MANLTALSYLRKRAGLTQEELGKMLGVGCSSVSRWESGENNIEVGKLPQLAKILECSIDDLFEEQEVK